MALILALETATEVCSVALLHNNLCIKEICNTEGNAHARLLHVLVADLLSQTGKTFAEIDAIAVSMGPGSYTGLRVGVSAAKGYCFAAGLPLIAVNTLQSIAAVAQSSFRFDPKTLLCPMLDARRMEVYTAILSTDLTFIEPTQALILDTESYQHLLETNKIAFFGNGSAKFKEILHHENAQFIENLTPSAAGMASIAHKKFESKQFENLAYFEPFYLKEFIGTTPKRRL